MRGWHWSHSQCESEFHTQVLVINAWTINHDGTSHEEIWQLFLLKNQDAPSAALKWTMNAQVLRVPTTALITLISELVLKTPFMPQGVLCSCSVLSFRTCVWEVGCIMRHSPILCPHLYVGGFELAAAHLSLKKGLEETPLLAHRRDHMVISRCFCSTSRTAKPLIFFLREVEESCFQETCATKAELATHTDAA